MEIKINGKYAYLEDFIKKLSSIFETEGRVVYSARNQIRVIEVDGLLLNIKRFHKPFIANAIIYSFFRKPKACRAYHNALEVLARGFNTPEPVAYVLDNASGLLGLSYFVSLHLPEGKEIRDYYFTKGEGDASAILREFSRFTSRLHDGKIIHLDYSPGNVLYEKDGDRFRFSLVDINRMEFREVNLETGCKNFCRLFGCAEATEIIAEEYARQRGFDKALCTERMLYYQRRFRKKTERKDRLKEKMRR
ncbi:MAG: hypothetical protein H6Q14_2258 [Bacteroidetes bacterium]|jgi:serine/threonine protein kinase|nr:hypothetical protein [Bacteroidota bacterium]